MSADLLARLIEAGTPAALVGEVAMALAAAQAATAAQVDAALAPTKGALRMRRYRERHSSSPSVTCDASDAQVTENVTAPALSPAPLPSPDTPNQHPTPTPTRKGSDAHTCEAREAARPKPRWPKDMPPPPGVSDDQWAGFIEHRKAKRQALTLRAYDLLASKLAKFADDEWPPGKLIDLIVERGWLSFEPAWLPRSTETRHGQRSHHERPSGWAARPGAEGLEPASLDD